MASVYSRSHHNMSLSQEFEGGITNGASWYGNECLEKLFLKMVSMRHGSEINEFLF